MPAAQIQIMRKKKKASKKSETLRQITPEEVIADLDSWLLAYKLEQRPVRSASVALGHPAPDGSAAMDVNGEAFLVNRFRADAVEQVRALMAKGLVSFGFIALADMPELGPGRGGHMMLPVEGLPGSLELLQRISDDLLKRAKKKR